MTSTESASATSEKPATASAEPRRSLERIANRQTILKTLLQSGTTTRVTMADETGLSRPTVNAIVSELVEEGLAVETGSSAGPAGRAATLYQAIPTARTVIGIDLGGSKTIAGVADVTGSLLGTKTIPTTPEKPGIISRLVELCHQLMREAGLELGSLVAVSVGAPGVPHPVTHQMQFAAYVPELADIDLRYGLSERLGLPVTQDNDVNMAIVGERWKGRAQNTRNAVFITIGTGLGMGVVAGGKLQRGSSGAAGEVGFLPIAGDPFDGVSRQTGLIEETVSAGGIQHNYDRIRDSEGGPELDDVRAIFAAAAKGTPAALRAIDEAARLLALVVSSVHAVLDPERVILGGSIGLNELMLTLLRTHLERLGRRPPVVEVSALEGRAPLLGAIAVGLQRAQLSVGLDPEFIVD